VIAPADLQKEALRQQMLLRAVFGDARPGVVAGWLRDRPGRVTRGLQAYRANAAALAERVLAAAFPTVAQLLGAAAVAGLARAHWHAEPPRRGDLAQWGEGLPDFIAADPQLAAEPYLADVARLDWAVHLAEQAADAPPLCGPPAGLAHLVSNDPAALWLQFAPGTTLVSSTHPVATIWQAHQPHQPHQPPGDRIDAGERFAPVRAAFAAGVGEHALVSRDGGWRADVRAVPEPESRFMHSLLDGRSLGSALQDAGAGFEFEPWLILSLSQGRIKAVLTQAPATLEDAP